MSCPELHEPTTTAFFPFELGFGPSKAEEWQRRSPRKVSMSLISVGRLGSPEWPVARTMWWGWKVPNDVS